MQFLNVLHDTQWLLDNRQMTEKHYRDFHCLLFFRPDHQVLLQFSDVFYDTQWLFGSQPVTGKHYRDFH